MFKNWWTELKPAQKRHWLLTGVVLLALMVVVAPLGVLLWTYSPSSGLRITTVLEGIPLPPGVKVDSLWVDEKEYFEVAKSPGAENFLKVKEKENALVLTYFTVEDDASWAYEKTIRGVGPPSFLGDYHLASAEKTSQEESISGGVVLYWDYSQNWTELWADSMLILVFGAIAAVCLYLFFEHLLAL